MTTSILISYIIAANTASGNSTLLYFVNQKQTYLVNFIRKPFTHMIKLGHLNALNNECSFTCPGEFRVQVYTYNYVRNHALHNLVSSKIKSRRRYASSEPGRITTHQSCRLVCTTFRCGWYTRRTKLNDGQRLCRLHRRFHSGSWLGLSVCWFRRG